MSWYNIDFKRLSRLLLPPSMRIKQIVVLLDCIIGPVKDLHACFLSFKKSIEYKLRHNSQVCYLQAVLNDEFDNSERRIYIKDAEVQEWERFLWHESDDKPIMLAIDDYFMLNREGFIGADAIDFIVCIPKALILSTKERTRMDAFLRYYKLASKRYIIEEYE